MASPSPMSVIGGPLAGSLNANPPLIAIAAAANAIKVYDRLEERRNGVLFLHNLAATPCKVYFNVDVVGDIDADNFNDIIAGGSAVDDGLGTQMEIDIQRFGITNIYLFHETTDVRVAVKKFLRDF